MKVNIILDKIEYYPGDYLTGKVKIEPDTKTSIKDVEMSLFLIEDWNHLRFDNKYDTCNNTQAISVFFLRIHLFLDKEPNDIIELEKKEYIFPFEEKLPDYLLPSLEFPQNKFRAFLRYTLTARVLFTTDKTASSTIFVKINSIPQKDNDIAPKCSIFNNKKGQTDLKVTYFTKNYKISDKIPVQIEIDNTKSKMKVTECKLKINRKILFRDKNDFSVKFSLIDKVIKNVYKLNIKKEKKTLNYDIDLKTINYKDFNYDGFTNPFKDKNLEYKDLIPSLDGNIIICEYNIEVMLKFDNKIKITERPKVEIPIFIVHKLSDNHIIEAKNEFERKKNKDNNKMHKNSFDGFEIIYYKNDEKNDVKNGNIINNNIIENKKKEEKINENKKEDVIPNNMNNPINPKNPIVPNIYNNMNNPINPIVPNIYNNMNNPINPIVPNIYNNMNNPINPIVPNIYNNMDNPLYENNNIINNQMEDEDDLDLPSRNTLIRVYKERDEQNKINNNNNIKNDNINNNNNLNNNNINNNIINNNINQNNNKNNINNEDDFKDIINFEEYKDDNTFNLLKDENNDDNNINSNDNINKEDEDKKYINYINNPKSGNNIGENPFKNNNNININNFEEDNNKYLPNLVKPNNIINDNKNENNKNYIPNPFRKDNINMIDNNMINNNIINNNMNNNKIEDNKKYIPNPFRKDNNNKIENKETYIPNPFRKDNNNNNIFQYPSFDDNNDKGYTNEIIKDNDKGYTNEIIKDNDKGYNNEINHNINDYKGRQNNIIDINEI